MRSHTSLVEPSSPILMLLGSALIWMAYSLETFLDQGMINSPPATVAPHCVGAGGGRCNLPELLEYLWAPQKGQFETDRPSVTYQLLKLNPIEEFDLFKVYKGTLSFREQRAVLGRGRVVTDLVHNIDYVRISTRATTFGEALGDLGTRIKTAYDECKVHAKDTTHPPGPNALSLEAVQQQIDRIYGMAKQSARSIYLLRRKEYEKTRLEDFGSLKSKVHLPIDPLTGEPYPVKSKTVVSPQLDRDAFDPAVMIHARCLWCFSVEHSLRSVQSVSLDLS